MKYSDEDCCYEVQPIGFLFWRNWRYSATVGNESISGIAPSFDLAVEEIEDWLMAPKNEESDR